jgi:hypothetical protein
VRKLALVLAGLATLAVIGAFVHRGSTPQAAVGATTAKKHRAAPRRPARPPSPLPGALLIADRGNDRVLLVDPHKRVLWRFPGPSHPNVHLHFDDDTFVEPGGKAIVSNEEENHTILSISIASGRVRHLYGRPGIRGSAPGLLNTPDDAYLLPDGTLTVADAYNCRILFIRKHRIVRQLGATGVCSHNPPRSFGAVNGDTPLKDGGVLVSEIQGSWVDDISRSGKLRWAVQAPVSYPSDPQPLPGGRILLADYAKPGAAVIMNRHGKVLWRYGPSSGWGELDHPSLAVMLPNGDVAINDDYNDRVVIVDPTKRKIVWQYGHKGRSGRGAGFLNTPDGMDVVPLSARGQPLWAAVHHP